MAGRCSPAAEAHQREGESPPPAGIATIVTLQAPNRLSHRRASFGIRLLAAAIDLLLVLFIALPFVRFDSRGVLWIAAIVFPWLYRRLFGATPGQQLVGIRTDRVFPALRLATTSPARQWLRGLGSLLLILYIGLTLSAGLLIAGLTDEKIDPSRVAIRPTDIATPVSHVSGERAEFDRVSVLLPRDMAGFPVEDVHCCAFYGGGPDAAVLQPGVLVAEMDDLHPYDYCRGVVNPTAGWLAGCGATPLAYQQAIAETIPAERRWTASPIGVVRTNFALVAKNIYLEELSSGSDLRRFRAGDAEVLWLRGTRIVKKTNETVQVAIDRFLIADAASFAAIDIVWKKVPRDERVAEMIAASIRLRKPTDAAIHGELAAANQGDSLLHLTNAFRMSGRSAETAIRLQEALAREGTARQKRSFANLMKSDAERNPQVRPIAASVTGWQ